MADIARPYPGGAYFATDVSRGQFRGNVYGTWEEGDFGPRLVHRDDQLVREESGLRREVVRLAPLLGEHYAQSSFDRYPLTAQRGPFRYIGRIAAKVPWRALDSG